MPVRGCQALGAPAQVRYAHVEAQPLELHILFQELQEALHILQVACGLKCTP